MWVPHKDSSVDHGDCKMKPPKWIIIIGLLVLLSATVNGERHPIPRIVLSVQPAKERFSQGEDVVLSLKLQSKEPKSIFLSRTLRFSDDITLNLVGPDGNRVHWFGRVPRPFCAEHQPLSTASKKNWGCPTPCGALSILMRRGGERGGVTNFSS
jgi:hypothetical protein